MIRWLVLLLIGLFAIALFFLNAKKVSAVQTFECRLGKFKIIALLDGSIDFQLQNIIQGQEAVEHPYLQETFPDAAIKIPINVYLVDMGSKIVLVDVGLAGYNKSTTGLLMRALDQAGYRADQITDILITHLHLDHVAGLLTADDKKVFPYAQLHVSKEDVAYWIYEQQLYPELAPIMTKLIVPYALHGFTQNQQLFEGVSVLSTPGHSPGHSSFLFESEGQKLLIWGDIVHIHELQFAHPEISLKDDSDQSAAIATRQALFAQLSEQSTLIAGAHLPFPGLGHVQKDIVGYTFVPLSGQKVV